MSDAMKLRGLTLGLAVVVAATGGCLANPQRDQSIRLFGDLVGAQSALSEQPPQMDPACGAVFNARTRLYGEPGLTADQRAWTALADSAVALAAVCGEATLLQVPPGPAESFAVVQARDRWQQDLPRQLEVACAHLRDAASALDRPAPC